MKKLLFAFIVLFSVISVSAQDSTKAVKIPYDKQAAAAAKAKRQADLDKKFSKFSKDRIAIELLAANWAYNPNDPRAAGLRTRWFSRGLNVNFYWDFRFKHSRVSIAPGLGYSITTINSRHQLVEDSAGAHFTPISVNNITANSITLQYIDVPVELRIRTNPDKFDNMWKICIGIKAGVRIDVHTRQTVQQTVNTNNIPNTIETKIQVLHHYPDFSVFRFGPTLRIGYSIFNITAYYGILNVFKKDRGPKANEFAIGLSINGL